MSKAIGTANCGRRWSGRRRRRRPSADAAVDDELVGVLAAGLNVGDHFTRLGDDVRKSLGEVAMMANSLCSSMLPTMYLSARLLVLGSRDVVRPQGTMVCLAYPAVLHRHESSLRITDAELSTSEPLARLDG